MKNTILLFAFVFSLTSYAQSFQQVFEGFADNRAERDLLGFSSSISGDYAVVGAPQKNFLGPVGPGFAMIYKRDAAGNWTEHQRIAPSDGAMGDEFGYSVSISGDYLVVGAPGADGTGSAFTNVGAVYLFHKNEGGSWEQVQKIIDSLGEPNSAYKDYSGTSVYISGQDVIVGNPDANNSSSSGAGSATIFKLNGIGTLDFITHLEPADNLLSGFGASVAIENGLAVVGAPYDQDEPGFGTNHDGSVYLFKRTGTSWDQGQRFVSTNPGWDQYYGSRVDISGNTALVRGNRQGGTADVFVNNGSSWSRVQTITSNSGNVEALSIHGNYAVLGLIFNGEVEVYKRTGSNFSLLQTIQSPSQSSDYFGSSVDFSSGSIVIGAYTEEYDANGANGLYQAGKCYIYEDPILQSVDDEMLDAALSVYPIPASSEVTVDLRKTPLTGVANISVYDVAGQQVITQSGLSELISIDLTPLTSGVYFLKVETDKAQASKKIVVRQ